MEKITYKLLHECMDSNYKNIKWVPKLVMGMTKSVQSIYNYTFARMYSWRQSQTDYGVLIGEATVSSSWEEPIFC